MMDSRSLLSFAFDLDKNECDHFKLFENHRRLAGVGHP